MSPCSVRLVVSLAFVLVASLSVTSGAFAASPITNSFVDDEGSVHEADIEAIRAAGITKGCNPPVNNRFCPEEPVTRGQMAAFLVRAMGYSDGSEGGGFVDVAGSVFAGDIAKLAAAGITKGCNPPVNNQFCPEVPVTRGQMASFLARALGVFAVGASFPTESVDTVIYVDANSPAASDDNPGSAIEPVESISAAIARAVADRSAGISVKIVVAPGTYRETVTVPGTPTPSDPLLIIEAAEQGEVVWSGAQLTEIWHADTVAGRFWTPWTHNWGLAPLGANFEDVEVDPIVRRRELVVVDGDPLDQVMTLEEVADGSYFVDEAADRLYVRLGGGGHPADHRVEIAEHAELLRLEATENVIVRGFVFQHSSAPAVGDGPKAAVVVGGSINVLLSDNEFTWNNGEGLWVGSGTRHITVTGNIANNNGVAGMVGWRIESALYEDNETSFNNWRGAWGDYHGLTAAGIKHSAVHDAMYTGHRSVANLTRGFWLDSDNENIIVKGATLCRNLTEGMLIEKSQGPVTVTQSVLCNNELHGLTVAFSMGVHSWNNAYCGNGDWLLPAILVSGAETQRSVANWETAGSITLHAGTNFANTHNSLGAGHDKALLLVRLPNPAEEEAFFATVISDDNVWVDGGAGSVVRIDEDTYDLANWRALSGQDRESVYGSGDDLACD